MWKKAQKCCVHVTGQAFNSNHLNNDSLEVSRFAVLSQLIHGHARTRVHSGEQSFHTISSSAEIAAVIKSWFPCIRDVGDSTVTAQGQKARTPLTSKPFPHCSLALKKTKPWFILSPSQRKKLSHILSSSISLNISLHHHRARTSLQHQLKHSFFYAE